MNPRSGTFPPLVVMILAVSVTQAWTNITLSFSRNVLRLRLLGWRGRAFIRPKSIHINIIPLRRQAYVNTGILHAQSLTWVCSKKHFAAAHNKWILSLTLGIMNRLIQYTMHDNNLWYENDITAHEEVAFGWIGEVCLGFEGCPFFDKNSMMFRLKERASRQCVLFVDTFHWLPVPGRWRGEGNIDRLIHSHLFGFLRTSPLSVLFVLSEMKHYRQIHYHNISSTVHCCLR